MQEELRKYYAEIMPLEQINKIISLENTREISFTFENNVFSRYNTFNNLDSFKKELIKSIPIKFDIGAIYKSKPLKGIENVFERKELVFDVDLTDYSRNCCDSKGICENCFIFIKIAVKLFEFILKQEFGFEKINYFFSGGRGLHCWVSDSIASSLTSFDRKLIVKYFNIVLEKELKIEKYFQIIKEFGIEKEFLNYFIKLDSNVTVEVKHLLKSPFCIHPNSKKVCVALNPGTINNLKLSDIPDLQEVLLNPKLLDAFVRNINY